MMRSHFHLPLVFIIGPHRSGTTLLYQLLAASGSFNVTTVFHILNHAAGTSRDELAQRFERLGIRTRLYDEVEVGPDQPEEYAYALSPQRRHPVLNDRNLPGFLRFARMVQVNQDPARPLLLKNPDDVVNFLYLRDVFPDARFIFIHRSPVDVIDSQIRMYHSILHRRNEYERLLVEGVRRLYANPLALTVLRRLFSDRSRLMLWLVRRRVVKSCNYVVSHLSRLDACATGVTYPELCRDPGEVMARVLRFLGVRPATPPDWPALVRPRDMRRLPIVDRHRGQIEAQTRDYREMFGV